jgi:hypothetical protein
MAPCRRGARLLSASRAHSVKNYRGAAEAHLRIFSVLHSGPWMTVCALLYALAPTGEAIV